MVVAPCPDMEAGSVYNPKLVPAATNYYSQLFGRGFPCKTKWESDLHDYEPLSTSDSFLGLRHGVNQAIGSYSADETGDEVGLSLRPR